MLFFLIVCYITWDTQGFAYFIYADICRFNCRYQNANKSIRLDVLVHALVKSLTRMLLAKHALRADFERQKTRHAAFHLGDRAFTLTRAPLAYLEADYGRDLKAEAITKSSDSMSEPYVPNNEIVVRVRSDVGRDSWCSCWLHPYECISCECIDFQRRGGFCKHLRHWSRWVPWWSRIHLGIVYISAKTVLWTLDSILPTGEPNVRRRAIEFIRRRRRYFPVEASV